MKLLYKNLNNYSIEEVWSVDPSSDVDDFDNETPPSLSNPNAASSPSIPKALCTWLVLFLSHFQVIFYLSDRAMDVLLKFMSAFFFVLGSFSNVCYDLANVFSRSLHRLKTYTGVNS